MEQDKIAAGQADDQSALAAEVRVTRAQGGGRAGGGLAVILSLIAIVLSGYVWYRVLYEQQALFNADVLGQLSRLEQTGKVQQEADDAANKQIKTLGDTQETLKQAVEQLRSDLGRSRADWALAEAEQLLLIANRRLQLARDVTSALAALRAADRQLDVLANPNLLPVRREIAREITQLEALEKTDVVGVSLQLSSLAESVDKLPLAQDIVRQPAAAPESSDGTSERVTNEWRGWREIWKDMVSLVRIRDDAGPQKPLLPPEQTFFLRENLRLSLHSAQLALLQGNGVVYQENLATAAKWLKQFFDPQAQAVNSMEQQLVTLQGLKGITDPPSLTGSLEALRKVMAAKKPS